MSDSLNEGNEDGKEDANEDVVQPNGPYRDTNKNRARRSLERNRHTHDKSTPFLMQFVIILLFG
jgi:hypothetical protein